MTGTLGQEAIALSKDGIRINAICPGYVETHLIKKSIDAGLFEEEFKRTPMGRPGQVEEIVDCMVFLASSMSSYMTGAALAVDGYVILALQVTALAVVPIFS